MKQIALGKTLITLESVKSTNDYASSMLKTANPPEGTVILAAFQTDGKGQAENSWVSEAGKNLLFSIILRPFRIEAEKQFYISMCISNGIAAFLESNTLPAVIKWPNDILVRERKIAGILIENSLSNRYLLTSVIGIGLNVNQKDFPSSLLSPTSVLIETGSPVELPITFGNLLTFLEDQLMLLYQGRLKDIRKQYLKRLWKLNEWALYKDKHNLFEGIITGIAETGELELIRRDTQLRQYAFKEITFYSGETC
jgi:BirA family biotin operon repressor/biotin-[acetyl-CoA-carboxylase] ligase